MHLSREVVRGVVRGGTMFVVGLLTFASFGLNDATSAIGAWGQATPAEFANGVQNTSRYAELSSVSCASLGNCTAVGYFNNVDGDREAFTISLSDGVWGQATPAEFANGVQNAAEDAYFKGVSCVSAGNCTAAGSFKTVAGGSQAFTMSSTSGVWGQAIPAVFNSGLQSTIREAEFSSVSCTSAGNCAAVGFFVKTNNTIEAFAMSSTNGVWGQAIPAVFANGVQNVAPDAELYSVSCASAGNCTAAGTFNNAAGALETFTMSSTNGVWGQATPAVFASGVQIATDDYFSGSVSCASAGNCTVAGSFKNLNNNSFLEAFTMSSTNGVWGQATPAVFGSGIQNAIPAALFNSVSCASAGNCTASGAFRTVAGGFEAFTMSSTNGVWDQAIPAEHVNGARDLSRDAEFYSVSCASAGNCTAVGYFNNAAGAYEAFTMSSTNGVWGQATPAVFASGLQNIAPETDLRSVSCASAGNCVAVGRFMNASGGNEAFTMMSTYNPPVVTTTTVAATTTTVVAVATLPATGSGSDGWTVVGLFAIVTGTFLITRRRRIS